MMLSSRERGQKQIYEMLSYFTDTVLFMYEYAEDIMTISPNAENMTGLKEVSFQNFLNNQKNGFLLGLLKEDREKLLHVCFCPPQKGACESFELQFTGKDGGMHWCVCKVKACYEEGEKAPVRLMGKLDDVSIQKEKETELLIQSTRDGLTGLLNKTAFEYLVNEALEDGSRGCLSMIDIDNFKEVNDQFGHQAGDGLLVYIGRLLNCVFGEDALIGRVGGDEFMVYTKECWFDREAVNACAVRLLESVATQGAGTDGQISVSVGIAWREKSGNETYQQLFARADRAMYGAKQNGKNRFVVYENMEELED